MSKYTYSMLLIAMTAVFIPVAASAGEFDGSKPLLCASIFSSQCEAESQECVSGAPWTINFPVFMEIDFKENVLSTTDQHKNARLSRIENIDHLPNGRLSIQGDDGEHAWSMILSEETGSMTLAVSGEEVGFLVFGACTLR